MIMMMTKVMIVMRTMLTEDKMYGKCDDDDDDDDDDDVDRRRDIWEVRRWTGRI